MDELAAACERVAKYSSLLRKIAALCEYFRTLSDADLERAVRFLASGPIAAAAGKKFSGRSPKSSQYMPCHVPVRAAMKAVMHTMPAASRSPHPV